MFNFMHYNDIMSGGRKEIREHYPSRWPACELSSESRSLLEENVCDIRWTATRKMQRQMDA